jgi:hypothetical protein
VSSRGLDIPSAVSKGGGNIDSQRGWITNRGGKIASKSRRCWKVSLLEGECRKAGQKVKEAENLCKEAGL